METKDKMEGEDEITTLNKKIEAIKAGIMEHMRNLPDNPKIRRLEGNKHCYVIRSKDLAKRWSPEFYDFSYQYKIIVDVLERSKDFFGRLREILDTGVIRAKRKDGIPGTGYNIYIHPDVTKNIRNFMEVKNVGN